jgi:hypothetical protein
MSNKLTEPRNRRPSPAPGSERELEEACITLLVRSFWCDATSQERRLYNILALRRRMKTDRNGIMVEVPPNTELRHGAKTPNV